MSYLSYTVCSKGAEARVDVNPAAWSVDDITDVHRWG
jgi:hypothetical protein